MLPVLEPLKRAKKSLIFQKCAKCTLTLKSNYEINFWLEIQILIRNKWNLPLFVTDSIFLQSCWILNNMKYLTVGRLSMSLNNNCWLVFHTYLRPEFAKRGKKLESHSGNIAMSCYIARQPDFCSDLVSSQKAIVGFQFLAYSLHQTGMRKLINFSGISWHHKNNFCFHEIFPYFYAMNG